MDRKTYWNHVYDTHGANSVSWYERIPERSLAYVQRYSTPAQRVIDVGAGTSCLVGALLDLGYADPIALDVSEVALERAEGLLGESARRVTWIAADITKNPELPAVDLWHDRAVLHFLTEEADQAAYARLAARTVNESGHLVVATFAPDGPEQCSGLQVQRHDGSSLAKLFGRAFDLLDVVRVAHRTPSGGEQRFTWAVLRRRTSELRRPPRSSYPESLAPPSG